MSKEVTYVVCQFDDMKSGEARRFDLEGVPVAVVRIADRYYAIGDVCTHQRISLSEGEVHQDTCELECWKHGSTFSLIDGRPSALPATKSAMVYRVEVTDLGVEVSV